MTSELLCVTMAILIAFIFIGSVINVSVPGLKKILLPGSVTGGLLLLAMGPNVLDLNASVQLFNEETMREAQGIIASLPAIFINVVFACLIAGRRIQSIGHTWKNARPQIAMGHIYAWGQYVVGISLCLLVINPFLFKEALLAPLIAMGFQGGHGTASGLASKFEQLGFADGATVAYAVATVGIIAGSILGPLLGTYLKHRNPIDENLNQEDQVESEEEDYHSFTSFTGVLTIHLAAIAFIISLGYVILQGLIYLEELMRPESDMMFTSFIPLFSLVLISGYIVQLLAQALRLDAYFSERIFKQISNFSLDMVIGAALATLSITVIAEHWLTIALLCFAGIAWNLTVFFILGPRIYQKPWYPYGLGDLGGGTATTATGLLLVRLVDPKQKTNALSSYSDKQPFYEPIMGGGLVTALALPAIAFMGLLSCLIICATILLVWVLYALLMVKGSHEDK